MKEITVKTVIQMLRLLSCKAKEDQSRYVLDDEGGDEDQCPTSEPLQEQLREFCALLVTKLCLTRSKEPSFASIANCKPSEGDDDETSSWVDILARLIVSVPPLPKCEGLSDDKRGTDNFRYTIEGTNNELTHLGG